MIDIAILRAMVAAGAPVESILAAIEADQMAEGARVQARRDANAQRQRDWRNGQSQLHGVTARDGCDTSAPLTSSLSSSNISQNLEKEGSKKVRATTARKTALPDDWVPSVMHHAKAEKLNFPRCYVEQKADDMRNWARSKAVMRADWDATFHGFLKPHEIKTGMNGHATVQRGNPWQNRNDAKHATLDKLRARVAENEREFEGGDGGSEPTFQLVPDARRA